MKEIVTFFSFYTDSKSSCLCISEIGAGTNFKVLLLSWRPRFNIAGLYLQVSQVTRAAFQLSDRNIHVSEYFYCISPHILIILHGVFRFTENNHFLFFKLVNSVKTSFFQTMASTFLTETWRIGCHSDWKFIFFDNLSLETTNHGMFRRTDQIQIFIFNLIHHCFHFRKGHNACNNIGMNHEWWNCICESLGNHVISCIGKHCFMKTCNIASQIIETFTGCSSCRFLVQTIDGMENISMIRNLIIRNSWFAESLFFYIFTVILTDRYRWINDVWNGVHSCLDFFVQNSFSFFQRLHLISHFLNLSLDFFSFFSLTVLHQSADFLGHTITISAKSITLLFNFSYFLIKCDDFINHRNLFILELLTDIFFNKFRIFSDKLNINHCFLLVVQNKKHHRIKGRSAAVPPFLHEIVSRESIHTSSLRITVVAGNDWFHSRTDSSFSALVHIIHQFSVCCTSRVLLPFFALETL